MRKIFPNFHPTRWKPLRVTFLYFISLIRPELLKVKYGITIRVPKNDRSFYTFFLWFYGTYEPECSDFVSKLIQPGDTVVDVGANIG